jgi:hypothetical protein
VALRLLERFDTKNTLPGIKVKKSEEKQKRHEVEGLIKLIKVVFHLDSGSPKGSRRGLQEDDASPGGASAVAIAGGSEGGSAGTSSSPARDSSSFSTKIAQQQLSASGYKCPAHQPPAYPFVAIYGRISRIPASCRHLWTS